MKILLIHNYYQYRGGEDTYVDNLIGVLQKKGHQVILFTQKSVRKNSTLFEKALIAKKLFLNKDTEDELTKLIHTSKPDLAHISNLFPSLSPVVYKVCRENELPIIQSMHTFRYLCPKGTLFRDGKVCHLCITKRFKYPAIYYSCYHNSRFASLLLSTSYLTHDIFHALLDINHWIFPSEQARNIHVKYLRLNKEKTSVVPNFVPQISISQHVKKRDYFIYVGRFSEEKGILPLLKVFATIPNQKLIVVGDGPLRNEVLSYATNQNISIKVNIPKKEVFSLLSQALCTIIPSPAHYEFGPLVLMESFACGTPALVPHGGVFLDRVIEGETGFFYDQYKSNDLKCKIIAVSNMEKKLNEMQEKVKNEFQTHYTADIHYSDLMSVYRKVLT